MPSTTMSSCVVVVILFCYSYMRRSRHRGILRCACHEKKANFLTEGLLHNLFWGVEVSLTLTRIGFLTLTRALRFMIKREHPLKALIEALSMHCSVDHDSKSFSFSKNPFMKQVFTESGTKTAPSTYLYNKRVWCIILYSTSILHCFKFIHF